MIIVVGDDGRAFFYILVPSTSYQVKYVLVRSIIFSCFNGRIAVIYHY